MFFIKNKISHIKAKNGFTLIELMAIIIIIGVVLLIIIPNVSGVLKRSEKKSFAASAKGIIRTANDYFADDEFTITEGDCINVNSGEIKFDKNYQITGGKICYLNGEPYLQKVTNGKYCATGNLDDLMVSACGQAVTVTFQVEDAFNNYFGYVADNNKNIFATNSNDFGLVVGNGSGDVNSLVINVESGDNLGTYIDKYKDTGYISYSYNDSDYEYYMSYYNFWDIYDSTLDACYKIVPAVWDKNFNSSTIIDTDTIYKVLALGIGKEEC